MALPFFVPVCLVGASRRVATTNSKKSIVGVSWQLPNNPVCTAVRRSWSLVEVCGSAKIMMGGLKSYVWNLLTGMMAYWAVCLDESLEAVSEKRTVMCIDAAVIALPLKATRRHSDGVQWIRSDLCNVAVSSVGGGHHSYFRVSRGIESTVSKRVEVTFFMTFKSRVLCD
jgi:hypothetical protein